MYYDTYFLTRIPTPSNPVTYAITQLRLKSVEAYSFISPEIVNFPKRLPSPSKGPKPVSITRSFPRKHSWSSVSVHRIFYSILLQVTLHHYLCWAYGYVLFERPRDRFPLNLNFSSVPLLLIYRLIYLLRVLPIS